MKALFTCGIGDFIAIEQSMTPQERNSIDEIWWATRQHKILSDLVTHTQIFPNLKKQTIVYDKWAAQPEEATPTLPYCLCEKADLTEVVKLPIDKRVLESVRDFSNRIIVNELKIGRRRFGVSTLTQFKYKLPEIELPEKFILIHPYSTNALTSERDFTPTDWAATLRYLHNLKMQGVVVNQDPNNVYPVPHNTRIINLTNQLQLTECFALAQKSSAFVGCASVFSVFYSKLNKPMIVKSQYNHLKNVNSTFGARDFYYWPQSRSNIIFPDLSKII